jgi:hypothetical protein
MKTAKAWTAAVAVALGTGLIKGIETGFGIDLPVEVETLILSSIAGFFTWLIPNAQPTA